MAGNEPEITGGESDPRKPAFREKGPPRQKRRKVGREEAWKRVEETRALLRILMSDSEIKRTLAKAWNVKPRLVEFYIARARKVNRAVVEIDENQALADAVNYWGKRLQTAEVKMQRAVRAREKEQAKLDKLDLLIEKLEAANTRQMTRDERASHLEELSILTSRRKTARDILRDYSTDEMRASLESRDAREHVDRIMGARHPIRIARVNSDGSDVKTMTPGEILEGLRLLGYGPSPSVLPSFEPHIDRVDQLVVVNNQPGAYSGQQREPQVHVSAIATPVPLTLPGAGEAVVNSPTPDCGPEPGPDSPADPDGI